MSGNRRKPPLRSAKFRGPVTEQVVLCTEEPIIYLDNSFVANYMMRENSKNAVDKDDDVLFVGEATIPKKSFDINLNRKVDTLTKENSVLTSKVRDLQATIKSMQKVISLEEDRRRLEKELAEIKCAMQNNKQNDENVAGTIAIESSATENVENGANSNVVAGASAAEVNPTDTTKSGAESNATLAATKSDRTSINSGNLSGFSDVLNDSTVKEVLSGLNENDIAQMAQDLQQFVQKL